MARFTTNPAGIVIVLEHEDIQEFSTLINLGRDITSVVAAVAAIPAVAVSVVSLYIRLQLELIKRLDADNGVYLTFPWAAIWIENPFLIIPTTRPIDIGPGPSWVAAGSGEFRTEDGADVVAFRIDQGVVPAEVVEFAIQSSNRSMWRKVLVMPDGQGSQWDIAIDPSQGTFAASNGLWAQQVLNGQKLNFWKAKAFGISSWVLDLGHLEGLPAGSRTTFSWLRD
jgi:hypothetical protein